MAAALAMAVPVPAATRPLQVEAQTLPVIKDKKSGIDMVLIPAGSFEMGSTTGREDEKPVHTVWIDSFLMDRTEVTQAEFEKIGQERMPLANPSHFKGADLPVEQVKMDQAAMFCNARSVLEGLKPCYNDNAECDFSKNGYRLPTEAEWEYACRAGTDTDYSFGNDDRQLGDFGWFSDNAGQENASGRPKESQSLGPVRHARQRRRMVPRRLFDKDYYKESPDKNPHGPTDGKEYVLRGGSWKSTATALRSSHRLGETPGFSDACLAKDAIGFRCVRKAP